MDTEKSFAELLLYYRSKAGLSQEELAKKSGVSKVQIAKYETNKSTPRLKAIIKLADALGVTEQDLGYISPIKTKNFTHTISSEDYENFLSLAKEQNKTIEDLYSDMMIKVINEILPDTSFKKYLKLADFEVQKSSPNEITVKIIPKKLIK